MTVFLGDDWAEAHHDVHLMDERGERLDARRLPEGLEGIAALHALVTEHADSSSDVVVGIETERGMWVQALVAAGYRVYAINPLSVSRYRDRHNVTGAKSDPGDAKVLADLGSRTSRQPAPQRPPRLPQIPHPLPRTHHLDTPPTTTKQNRRLTLTTPGCLAGYKVPRMIEFVDEIPKTGSNKILKRDLRAQFKALCS